MIFTTPTRERSARERWLAASVVAHVLALGVLFLHPPVRVRGIVRPGSRAGHLATLTYLPGASTVSQSTLASTHPETIKAAPRPLLKDAAKVEPKLTAPAPPVAPAATSASGNDAFGDGDVTVALVDNHPPPQPDLSQLPAGTHGDVVVDVVIGPDGRITQSKLVRGLGHGVDDAVLAIVQSWTYHPALKNGAPVASEQELLFHYDRG